jgi:menaquinol-cytochrome c reductase cytochrome b subunit
LNTIVQAIIGSVIVHLNYFIITMVIGYIKTKRYVPDIESTWESVNNLTSEVEFGRTVSPVFYLGSFVGVTVICGLIIFVLKISFI